MTKQPKILDEINRTRFEVVITDLETALTFTRIASQAGNNSEKKSQDQANAGRAYESMLRRSRKVEYTVSERKKFG
jgi:hypothetical protein